TTGGTTAAITTVTNGTNLPATGGGTASASIQKNLETIPALAPQTINGVPTPQIAVTGPAGGPYTITFRSLLSAANLDPISSNNSGTPVIATVETILDGLVGPTRQFLANATGT